MPASTEFSVNLDLWRKRNSAPENERWKWYRDTWDPIIDKVYSGEKDVKDLECPVCGKKNLYAYFLSVDIAANASKKEGRRVYIADRWFGCHACETQVRDRGEIPRWVMDKDIKWVTDGLKNLAEQKLAQSQLADSQTEQDAEIKSSSSSEADEKREGL